MPKGPRGEKRTADVIGAAVMVTKIATGEIEEDLTPRGFLARALSVRRLKRGGRKALLSSCKSRLPTSEAGR